MAPIDAFVTLENARCEKGVLSKRLGIAKIAQMSHGGVAKTYPINGLYVHTSSQYNWIIACDRLRPNVYDVNSDALIDVSGDTDLFSGRAADLFWFQIFDGKTYFTNGIDGIYVFNGETFDPGSPAAVTALDLTTDTASFTAAKMIFFLNDRLIAYDIIDDGTLRPYRMRYSQALARGNTPVFTAGGYLDIPTDDTPVTGRRLGRDIYLWYENSIWKIGPSGNTALPFIPDLIRGDLGSKCRQVCIPFRKGLLTVGHKDLNFFDGFEVKPMNLPNLRDILNTFEWESLKYSWGVYDQSNGRFYITFTATGSVYPDRILDYNINDNTAAIHIISAASMAMFDASGIPSWDMADDAYAFDGATMADMNITSQYPLTTKGQLQWFPIFGGQDGWLYQLFSGTDDAGSTIEFKAKSARFNPFSKTGERCALGRVAVLVDTSATASFTINLYKNTSSTAYKTQTITCTGSGDKHWESIHAGGEMGDFHQIEFTNDASANTPVIHATYLEMEAAGMIDP